MNIAYVLVQSTIGHEMEVLSDLLKIDFVKEAKGTFGYYDILVKIEASSEKEIVRIITKRLGRSTEHKKWFYIQPTFKYQLIHSLSSIFSRLY